MAEALQVDGQRRLAAVLFDLDGTLVDTEPAWIAAERALVESFGGTWTHEHGLALVGNPLLVSGEHLRAAGVDLPAEQIVDILLDSVIATIQERVPWRAGALDLLTEVATAGVPCALVTMSYRRLAQVVVDALPMPVFSSVVTGDEVRDGKPHPEAYLKAAAELGVQPQECVVVEDSLHGVLSGEAAGCVVVAVPQYVQIARHSGRTVAGSLTELSLAALQALVTEARSRR